jgi:hypothetical protein
MEPLTQSAAQGMTQLQQMGLAGLFLSFILIGGIWVVRTFKQDCEKRTDAALEAFKREGTQNREVIEKNTEGFHGMREALIKLEAKIEK